MKRKLLTLFLALCAMTTWADVYLCGNWGIAGQSDWSRNEKVKFNFNGSSHGTLTLNLQANRTYNFKLWDTSRNNGSAETGDNWLTDMNEATMTFGNCKRWVINKHISGGGGDSHIITTVAGTYVFNIVLDNGGPHLSVTYPDSYEKLDYIEFKGNDISKTIHTGYVPNANTVVETKFNAYTSGNGWRAIFSGRNNTAGTGISLYVNGDNQHLGYFVSDITGNGDNFADLTLNTDHTVTASLASLIVDGTTHNVSDKTSAGWKDTNRDITLFSNPEKDQSYEGRIYYFRIRENGNLIHNFVPVRRVSDGAVGFLDTKTNIFATPSSGKTQGFAAGTPNRDWGQNNPWLAKYVFKNYEDKNDNVEDGNAVNGLDALADPDNDSKGLDWTMQEFDDSGWGTMIMPCHNSIDTNENGTKWEGYYNCYWFRRHFYLTENEINTKTITILNVHDDDYELYVNGHLVVKKDGWEDKFNSPVQLTIPSGYLRPGDNVIAAEVQQNWGGAWFDCAITTADLAYTEIGTAAALKEFAEAVNGGKTTKNAKLTADIDLAGVEITMIGNGINKFQGIFDGQGHKIKNMTLSKAEGNAGLFGVTNGALIQDVELYQAKVTVTSGQNTGVLVGTAEATTINRCAVVNSYLNGYDHTGSIAGCAKGNSLITNCYSNAKVNSYFQSGGMVGTSEGLHIEHCVFMGQSIDAQSGARGLISLLEGGTTVMNNNLVATQHVFGVSGSSNSLVAQSGKTLVVDQNYSWNSTRYGSSELNNTYSLDSNDANGYQIAPASVSRDFFNARGFDFENDWKMVTSTTYANGSYAILKWMDEPAADVTINNLDEYKAFSHFMWDKTNATLAADIKDVDQPIGNDWVRFKGTFNGQGHAVTLNIMSTADAVGLIGDAVGGATIQNVITKGGVSGKAFVGGIVGRTRGAGDLTIENCGNEATITASAQNAGGILGCNNGGESTVKIINCYNDGVITGEKESAAIAGWTGDNTVITNTYNIVDVINGREGNKTFVRWNSGKCTNCYTTLSADPMDGLTHIDDREEILSGELCYNLGGTFTQDLHYDDWPTFGKKPVLKGEGVTAAFDYYNVDDNYYYVHKMTLNEGNETVGIPSDATGFAEFVTLTRSLKANTWNTFCIPFDMDQNDIQSQLGYDAKVKELTGVAINGENYSMTFSDASSIEAGKPYMVRVQNPVSEINRIQKNVKGALNPTEVKDSGNTLTFTGVYANGNAPEGSFIISNNTFYLVNSTVALKAFRGYITVDAGGQVKALNYIFDDTEDGIGTLTEAQPRDGEEIYNLAGQRIQKMHRGVNIVNGKKVLF